MANKTPKLSTQEKVKTMQTSLSNISKLAAAIGSKTGFGAPVCKSAKALAKKAQMTADGISKKTFQNVNELLKVRAVLRDARAFFIENLGKAGSGPIAVSVQTGLELVWLHLHQWSAAILAIDEDDEDDEEDEEEEETFN